MKLLALAALFTCSAAPLTGVLSAQNTPGRDAAPITTLRTGARLTVVDVVVTDHNHHPVHGLRREDFTLLEDKQPQALRFFEEQTPAPADPDKTKGVPILPPGIFTNYPPVPAGAALNVVLLDAINTPLQNQQIVRNQLLKFVKQEKSGTSVAIFGLSTQLVMLQGFTDNPEILRQAIERQSGKRSVLLNDVAGGNGTTPAQSDLITGSRQGSQAASAGGAVAPDAVSSLRTFDDIQKSFQLQARISYTLDGLNALARYLAGIPGRKNLIWFSGSFPFSILPAADASLNPFAAVSNEGDEYRDTVNLLTRAQVAVYPVDARGLQVNPGFSASNVGTRAPSPTSRRHDDFAINLAAEQETMLSMAAETGGRAFLNTNDLTKAVADAIDDGASYYTLAYAPPASKRRDDFRRIEVKLAKQGYTLNYRRGYYADEPPDASAAAKPGQALVDRAIRHGVPGATQLIYTQRVLPEDPAGVTCESLAPGNIANQPGFPHIEPPYRNYILNFGADPRLIELDKGEDGNYHGAVDFLSLVYQADGRLANHTFLSSHLDLTPAQYASLLRGSLTLRQEISVPAKGDYFLRTAIHDLTSDRIGSREISLALVKNLPPAPVPAESPTGKPSSNAAPAH